MIVNICDNVCVSNIVLTGGYVEPQVQKFDA